LQDSRQGGRVSRTAGLEKHRKSIGKPWETIGTPQENGDSTNKMVISWDLSPISDS
jgi:hypothetical protein